MGKVQKKTRTEIKEFLINMNDNIDEEILEVISIEPFSGIIANDYFEAGQQTTDYYCHNCGNKYQELRASRYGYPRKACPTCGKSTIYTTKRLQSSNLKLYVRETENGFDFAIFIPCSVKELFVTKIALFALGAICSTLE